METKPVEFKDLIFRVSKSVLRPLWKLRDFLVAPRYRPEKYWKARHTEYVFDLRGVGNKTLSHEENLRDYLKAKQVFLDLCVRQRIDFRTARILDIGCGTGFYSGVILENGAEHYTGVDITDQLFSTLRKDFADFEFIKLDVSRQKLKGEFDLIIMIDVTQHILSNRRFRFAMQNIRSHLAESGVFIVTSRLTEKIVYRTYYAISRPMSFFEREFPSYYFTEPIPFRDKFIFAISKCQRHYATGPL